MGGHSEWDWPDCLPGTQLSLAIPARLELLPVLGAAVREYCAILPHLLNPVVGASSGQRQHFGSGSVELPGYLHVTFHTSFSHFVYSIELILQEAASNIIRHGYGNPGPSQNLRLELGATRLSATSGHPSHWMFLMEISDSAPPFDPTKAYWNEPDPLEPRESGYGIYLIRKLTDKFNYQYQQNRNILRMMKYIDSFS